MKRRKVSKGIEGKCWRRQVLFKREYRKKKVNMRQGDVDVTLAVRFQSRAEPQTYRSSRSAEAVPLVGGRRCS
jgi:hypothetical protein